MKKKMLSFAALLVLSLLIIQPVASAFPINPFGYPPYPQDDCDGLRSQLQFCLADATASLNQALANCATLPQGSQQQLQCEINAYGANLVARMQCQEDYELSLEGTSC